MQLPIRVIKRAINFAAFSLLLALSTPTYAQSGVQGGADIAARLLPVIQLLLLGEDIPKVPQVSLIVDQASVDIFIGSTATNAVTGGSGNGRFVFSSSDSAIASVDATSGEINALMPGTVTITVFKKGNGVFFDSDPVIFTVAVNPLQAQTPLQAALSDIEVAINSTANNIVSGGSGTGALSFSSSDVAIASIDVSTGMVAGVTPGVATIIVTKASDPMFEAASTSYTVTVVKIEQAAISFAQNQLSVEVGGVITQAAQGGDGTGAFSYSSGNQNIATVDAVTGQVTGVAIGQATISAVKAGDAQFMPSATESYNVMVIMATETDCTWDNDNWGDCDWQ